MLKKYFPYFGVKNIAIYYLLAIFLNGWFVLPNWMFYFSTYLNKIEIGKIDGIAILAGILMEVPSGSISDLVGKKKTLLFGNFLIGLGCLSFILATNFTVFLAGNILTFIGFAFNSGSLEALAYDSLIESGKNDKYSIIISKYTFIATTTTIASTILGGLLYKFNPRYPFIAWLIFLIIAIFLIFLSREPKVDTIKVSLQNYFKQLSSGIRTLSSQRLRTFIVPIIFLYVFARLYQGIIRQSMAGHFGFNGETFAYLFGLTMIPAAFLSYKFDILVKKYGEKKLLLFILFTYLSAFTFALFANNFILGGTVFLFLMVAEYIAQPYISLIVNERIDSKYRVTTLSTLALISQIPYILLVLFAAHLTEVENIKSLYIFYFVGLLVVFLYSLFFVKKEKMKDSAIYP